MNLTMYITPKVVIVLHQISERNDTTRQAMYVKRNNEARSYFHCCHGEVLSITHSECVFVD
jgi:hypothetical protein